MYAFTLSKKIEYHLLEKKQPHPRKKPSGLAAPNKTNQI